MAKCLIHIGMEKTGSTSIQQALIQNKSLLERLGVAFPQAGLARMNHNFLASSYLPEGSDRLVRGLPARVRAGDDRQFLAAYRKNLMAEIRGGHHVVLSGEHLFRLRSDEIAMLKQDLTEADIDDVLVLGILRSPAPFYLSFVQQEVKGSSRFPAPGEFFIDYAERVAAWQSHFRSVFLDFNVLIASEQGVVKTFAEHMFRFMGLDPSLFQDLDRVANDSLSPEEMQIVQDFRSKWYPERDGRLNRSTNKLIKALQRCRDGNWRKPILCEEVSAFVRDRHKKRVGCSFQIDRHCA